MNVTLGALRFCALLVPLAVSAGAQGAIPSADSARMARTDTAIRTFQREWADAWRRTQVGRPFLSSNEYVREAAERSMAAHCHWDLPREWLRQRLIRGSTTSHATCPRFLPPDVTTVPDERRRIDNGLSVAFWPEIAASRRRLRMVLDSIGEQAPSDAYLTGQRVRFALDAGDFGGAAAVALSCGYEPVTCGLLQGLILYRVGDVVKADSAFTAAANLMSPAQRCAWSDVRVLLESDAREKYEQMTCAGRAEFEARFWWLADPLWLEPGNERRAEHFARQVTIGLLAPLGDDGRQHFTRGEGGEAVVESLVRYGWPTQMFWGGPQVDVGHDDYLLERGAMTARPYVVREYARARRLHTVPSTATLDDPFDAPANGWQLTAPEGDNDWWPRELYARDSSAIAQLPDGQSVMLRRRSSTRFVWAGDLDSAAVGRTVDPLREATLFDSRAVGDVKRIGSFPLRGGSRAVVDALLAEGRTLLGIEVRGDTARAAARTRFGAEIEPPLSALGPAGAISRALLFEAPADANRSAATEDAIAHMYASTILRDAKRVGVYWESYGFRPSDTLDLSVRISGLDQPNAIVRAIRVLGIGESGGNDVAIRWREVPGNSRGINWLEGGVPVQARSIVIEISRLARGHYALELSMKRAGGPAATSERRFEIR